MTIPYLRIIAVVVALSIVAAGTVYVRHLQTEVSKQGQVIGGQKVQLAVEGANTKAAVDTVGVWQGAFESYSSAVQANAAAQRDAQTKKDQINAQVTSLNLARVSDESAASLAERLNRDSHRTACMLMAATGAHDSCPDVAAAAGEKTPAP